MARQPDIADLVEPVPAGILPLVKKLRPRHSSDPGRPLQTWPVHVCRACARMPALLSCSSKNSEQHSVCAAQRAFSSLSALDAVYMTRGCAAWLRPHTWWASVVWLGGWAACVRRGHPSPSRSHSRPAQ
ncbi:hypothetical protein HaLaN_21722 [Haematococcus lacustris]|uniref:Uncharacterized protein n=1 Tax=Haematococcus lacustris TaxID=44745 RepID=A0A699ZS73_HAELA|nr:hypothetical protein HaLaN_21722 [Haematococcus lacustris]